MSAADDGVGQHAGHGDCILAENEKEAAYRKLPEEQRGTHVVVHECRDCGRKRAHPLDGHRGPDLDMRRFGAAMSVDDVLKFYGVDP